MKINKNLLEKEKMKVYGLVLFFAVFTGISVKWIKQRGRQPEVYQQAGAIVTLRESGRLGQGNDNCGEEIITQETRADAIERYCQDKGVNCSGSKVYPSSLTCHSAEDWQAFEKNGRCVDPYCDGCECIENVKADIKLEYDDQSSVPQAGEEFWVKVAVNPNGERLIGADIELQYNNSRLTYLEAVPSSANYYLFLKDPEVADLGSNKGRLILSAAKSPERNLSNSEEVILKIKFRRLEESETEISVIKDGTIVAVKGVGRNAFSSAENLTVGLSGGGGQTNYSCSGLNFSQENGIISLSADISPANASYEYLYRIDDKGDWTRLPENTISLDNIGAVAGDKISIAVKLIDDGVGGDCTEWNHDSVPNCTMNGCRIYGAYTVTGNEGGGGGVNNLVYLDFSTGGIMEIDKGETRDVSVIIRDAVSGQEISTDEYQNYKLEYEKQDSGAVDLIETWCENEIGCECSRNFIINGVKKGEEMISAVLYDLQGNFVTIGIMQVIVEDEGSVSENIRLRTRLMNVDRANLNIEARVIIREAGNRSNVLFDDRVILGSDQVGDFYSEEINLASNYNKLDIAIIGEKQALRSYFDVNRREVIDLTYKKLKGGDLPMPETNGQDGVIDMQDLSYIQRNSGSIDPTILAIGDVNYDGKVNMMDFGYLIEVLSSQEGDQF